MFLTARSTAKVAGRSGGSSNGRVEAMRYLALWAREKRGIVTRTSPSPTASSAPGSSGMCSPPVGSGRRAGLQRAASRSGPPSSSYVTKPSRAAAGACVSGVMSFLLHWDWDSRSAEQAPVQQERRRDQFPGEGNQQQRDRKWGQRDRGQRQDGDRQREESQRD